MPFLLFSAAQSDRQSLSVTLDGVTVAASQGAQHGQSLTATLDGVVVAASQSATHPQSLAITLDGVTAAGSQVARHPQSLALTLDGVEVVIAQDVQAAAANDQAMTAGLDGVTVAASQGVTHGQEIAAALDDVTAAVTQGPEVATGGWTPRRRKDRYQIEINGELYYYSSAEAALRAFDAAQSVKPVAEQAKRPAVRVVKTAPTVAPVPQWDDEDDVELLLLAA